MPDFTAVRVTRSHTIILQGNIDRVFPLFTPEGERRWIADWDFDLVYSESGDAEPGMVFTTHKYGETAVWVMTQQDRDTHVVEYIRVEPEEKVGVIQVQCATQDDGQTAATVTYTFTALSDAGNTFIAGFTEAYYQDWIDKWGRAINHYLETGEALPTL